ncbi:methylamine utilization protein [Pseudomonas zhanjiangensis]|uniref:Methylamine utilization protein n=1 Tax=Pseudomonas zhanjiangensis TaxID=3239015 RepID=A0ABV3YR05_9PSED
MLLGAVCAYSSLAAAASLQARLVDAGGQPLANAVLSLRGPLGAEAEPPMVVMDQQAKQFVPNVLAVRTGSAVSFPNSDDIRHHVYSFSPAKRFELRLYQGTPSEPVRFDTPGVVVLGCNIHDWMVGYVYVTDDPWFVVSDQQGRAPFAQLPPGRYSVSLWHPLLPDMQPQAESELMLNEQGGVANFTLAVPGGASSVPAAPAPSAFGSAFKKAMSNAP